MSRVYPAARRFAIAAADQSAFFALALWLDSQEVTLFSERQRGKIARTSDAWLREQTGANRGANRDIVDSFLDYPEKNPQYPSYPRPGYHGYQVEGSSPSAFTKRKRT